MIVKCNRRYEDFKKLKCIIYIFFCFQTWHISSLVVTCKDTPAHNEQALGARSWPLSGVPGMEGYCGSKRKC